MSNQSPVDSVGFIQVQGVSDSRQASYGSYAMSPRLDGWAVWALQSVIRGLIASSRLVAVRVQWSVIWVEEMEVEWCWMMLNAKRLSTGPWGWCSELRFFRNIYCIVIMGSLLRMPSTSLHKDYVTMCRVARFVYCRRCMIKCTHPKISKGTHKRACCYLL